MGTRWHRASCAVVKSAVVRAKPIALTEAAAKTGEVFILDDPIFPGSRRGSCSNCSGPSNGAYAAVPTPLEGYSHPLEGLPCWHVYRGRP